MMKHPEQCVGQTEIDVARYAYDALGRRIYKYDPALATPEAYYYYNDQWQILAEYTNATACRHWFTYGNYVDEVLSRSTHPTLSLALQYYTHDHLYSPAALTNYNAFTVWERYEYDAYGKVTMWNSGTDGVWYTADDAAMTSSTRNIFFFTGRQLDTLDASTLHHMHYRHRDYSPAMGRFLQQDPLDYIDGMNYYIYVKCNPTINLDPFGLVCGSGWSDPVVPDNQYIIPQPWPFRNADFTPACQDHDDCYGGTGKGGCNTSKEDCDKNLRDDIRKACQKEYSGWGKVVFPGQYVDCLLKAEIYYQAVKRAGQSAFDNARKNNSNCNNSCPSAGTYPIIIPPGGIPSADDFWRRLPSF